MLDFIESFPAIYPLDILYFWFQIENAIKIHTPLYPKIKYGSISGTFGTTKKTTFIMNKCAITETTKNRTERFILKNLIIKNTCPYPTKAGKKISLRLENLKQLNTVIQGEVFKIKI